MAFATQDRIGKIEARPNPNKTSLVLAAGERIWKHTLCGLLAATGEAVRITDANKNALSGIFYTDEQLASDQFNNRVHAGGPYETSVDVLSDMVVFLDTDGAFAPGDEESEVYLLDDHTVTLTPNADPTLTPYVGKLKKVITANIVSVWVPGLFRS
jgi:hypothetical protein